MFESTCFYILKRLVHVFCPNFSQARMFCDSDCSKLIPESTQPGGFLGSMIVDNITKNQKVKI